MRKTLRLLGHYVRLNLSGALEYRASFFLSAFGMLLNNCTFIFFWYIAFEQIGGRIGGYDFRDMMFVWAAFSSAYGASHIIFGNVDRMSQIILTGEMDTYLLQPKNPLLSMLCARTELSAWGDFVYGIALMLLTGQGALAFFWFVIAVVLGGALYVAVGVMFGSLAFFFGDMGDAGSFAMELTTNFGIYPEGIYQGFARFLMYTVVPAAFIVHVPLKLARGGALYWIPIWLLAACAYTALAYLLFKLGLKKYASGNLVVARL